MSLLICKIYACVYLSNCSCHQDLDMRFGFDLCSDERAFLGKRKKYVASALKNVFHLQEDLQDHEVCVCVVGVELEFLVALCTLLEERSAKWAALLCIFAAEFCYFKKQQLAAILSYLTLNLHFVRPEACPSLPS